jgi:hypothetical protein
LYTLPRPRPILLHPFCHLGPVGSFPFLDYGLLVQRRGGLAEEGEVVVLAAIHCGPLLAARRIRIHAESPDGLTGLGFNGLKFFRQVLVRFISLVHQALVRFVPKIIR